MYVDELIHKLKIAEDELQKIKDELMHTKERINIYIMKNKKEERKTRVKEDKEK